VLCGARGSELLRTSKNNRREGRAMDHPEITLKYVADNTVLSGYKLRINWLSTCYQMQITVIRIFHRFFVKSITTRSYESSFPRRGVIKKQVLTGDSVAWDD
jgi:hypothetical protein